MNFHLSTIKLKKNTAAEKLQNLNTTSEYEDMTIIDEFRDNQFKIIVGVNFTGIHVKDKIKCNLKLNQKPFYDEIHVYGNLMKPLVIFLIPFIIAGVLSFAMHYSIILFLILLSTMFLTFFGMHFYNIKKQVDEKIRAWLK